MSPNDMKCPKMKRPLVLAGVMLLLSTTSVRAQEHADSLSTPYVTPTVAKAWQEESKGVIFLDVRQADEFAAGHLAGAINIVYTEVASVADRLPHDRPIVTYCIHSTHRAPAAARALREIGFDNAYVLEGGIVAWQAGGLTIHTDDLAKAPTILPFTERCRAAKAHS